MKITKSTKSVTASEKILLTSNASNKGTAVQHIKAAIDILAKDAKKDEVKKDIIANLSVVMFDLMGSDM